MDQMRSKNSLTYNMTTLYREVNGRVRYYKIRAYLTLFGEYLLIREWGGVDNKKATGQKQSYFLDLASLEKTIIQLVTAKRKKGYAQEYRILNR